MIKKLLLFFLLTSVCIANEYTINFPEVSMKEFIKFVSKVSNVNFIYNEKEVEFTISCINGSPTKSEDLLLLCFELLKQNKLHVEKHGSYYIVKPMNEKQAREYANISSCSYEPLSSNGKFNIIKLQYHQGDEILTSLKQIAKTLNKDEEDHLISQAIDSMQWISSSNTLVFSATPNVAEKLQVLIKRLDKQKKQVYIEVLVLETDTKNSLDFGLDWSANGNLKPDVGFSISSAKTHSSLPITDGSIASKISKFPIGGGFNLGVIGDIILHKGKTFFTLGSLLQALEQDQTVKVVLNQKILAQDNQKSTVFVGDNLPFAGSVIETIGSAQQTTSNIEYRDVGVNLTITPMLGDSNVITLDIIEEISEAKRDLLPSVNGTSGIQTSKTNMVTKAHVPDNHFLILSGMAKNSAKKASSAVPCLGGLPLIGALFSKKEDRSEKRQILIFVRPRIIHPIEENLPIAKQEKALAQS